MTVGNCGCSICGLRGYSKNVAIRAVFATFEGRPILLEGYDSCMVARQDPQRPDQYLFGSRKQDWSKEETTHVSLADTLIEYLKSEDAKIEDLKILLCVHNWVQDPGTESV